jgi:2-dehydropantoate 2-reductase
MVKILAFGTGAIGGLYAAKLAQAGAEVSVISRTDYDEVKENGFQINSVWGDFNFKPHEILREISEFKGEADFIVVATKVLPEISLVELLTPIISEKTTIVLIQNGIFIEDEVAKAFPNHQLLSVIAFVDVIREKSALIQHRGDGVLTIGEFNNANPEKTQILADLFTKVQVPIILSKDIQFDRWKKLLWNASFNPISVTAGDLNSAEILAKPELEKLVKDVMLEVKKLAKAEGYEIPEELIPAMIEATRVRINPAITSMLLDFRCKRPMEVEAILGNSVRFAKENNVEVPFIEGLYEELTKINV